MREDWYQTTLGKICNKSLNIRWKDHLNKKFEYIDLSSVSREKLTITETTTINSQNAPSRAKKIVLQNDVIFATTRPTLRRATIINKNYHNQICSTGYAVLRPNKTIVDEKYIYYFLLSSAFMQRMESLQRGASYPAVSDKDVFQTSLLLPKSLKEQKQIVAILDKAFTAIDQAKANIEKNIENAKELFQSKLNDIFNQPALSGVEGKGDGWEEKTLKEITTKIGSGATPRGGQASYKESGVSLIRSMNVYDDGFREKKLAFIDEEQASKLNNVTIQENDVLLNITGASVARCCVVDNSFLPARVNQHVSIIRLEKGIMNHRFLHYALTSKKTKDLLLGIGEQGATRQAITKVQLENFRIAFPLNIEVQNKLVESFDELRNNTEKIESYYNQKLINLEDLKKSILQKAFVGELTKQSAVGSKQLAVNIE